MTSSYAHADDFVTITNLNNGWLLLEILDEDDDVVKSIYKYGRWCSGWQIDVHGYVNDCSSYTLYSDAKKALIKQLDLENKDDLSLSSSLLHWANCFRNGALNDQHSDRIAKILELAANDVSFEKQLNNYYKT
jgi:hypothetical protein